MATVVPARGGVAYRRRWISRATIRKSGLLGGSIILILIVFAVLAPLLAPYPPNAIQFLHTLEGPRLAHLLGTDYLGRDILSRLIFGARLSLLGPLLVVGISTAVGVPLGLLGGYAGGAVDMILGRVYDLLLGFPPLLLAIAAVAAFSQGFTTAVLAIAIIYVPLLARVVRSAVIVERNKAYVDACKVRGFRASRIVFGHVLPVIVPTIVAQATLNFGYALLDLAGLAFLGLGVQPPTADWGVMLSEGRKFILLAPEEVLAASVTIAVAVVAFNLLGDALAQRYSSS